MSRREDKVGNTEPSGSGSGRISPSTISEDNTQQLFQLLRQLNFDTNMTGYYAYPAGSDKMGRRIFTVGVFPDLKRFKSESLMYFFWYRMSSLVFSFPFFLSFSLPFFSIVLCCCSVVHSLKNQL